MEAALQVQVNNRTCRSRFPREQRYPWIVEATLKNKQKHFVIDGEAVIQGVDGYSDLN